MTTFYLIRHAEKDTPADRITGRMPGVHLSEAGLRQAEHLADFLTSSGISLIVSSPLERARETALPLAERLGLPIQDLEEIGEVDFGDWTNLTLSELDRMEGWKLFNQFRSGSRIPGGETMLEVQARFVRKLEVLARSHSGQRVAVFSHSDPIKTVLVHYLGMSLDLMDHIEVSPASVSTLALYPWGVRVLGINRPC
jgi:broad specificity phosphatase PhoE